MSDKERPQCPKCNSFHVSRDGDTIEQLDNNGQLIIANMYWWWECDNCGHQFRYQDETLNP